MSKGIITIELRSDLCASSGYSFAGIIDSDVCYDEFGIPYIPARRLKGCMRQAFETILMSKYVGQNVAYNGQNAMKDGVESRATGSDITEQIFGKPGDYGEQNGGLTIGNAYITGYNDLREQLRRANKNEKLKKYCSSEQVINRFSRVIGQTAMKDGVADHTSLRYTRVVSRISPITKENLCFEAEVSCELSDGTVNSVKLLLEDIAKATRHIGLKRNRGMGNVRCSYTEQSVDENSTSDNSMIPLEQKQDYVKTKVLMDNMVELSFAVRNIQPLMVSSMKEDESENYISGQQVLGLLASIYLKKKGNSADSPEFRKIFLGTGGTKFSNLYPYDGSRVYYPAPEYINRLKKDSKKYVFTLQRRLPEYDQSHKIHPAEDDKYEYDYTHGNQPKKLKGKFVSILDEGGHKVVRVYDVKKDIIYHHSHRNTHLVEGREEGIIYTGEAIREGQMFAGSIIVNNDYVETIKECLIGGDLYFGKSRSAQYGKCVLEDYEKLESEQRNEGEDDGGSDNNDTENRKKVVVTLLSDLAVMDENRGYVVTREDVVKSVGSECFKKYKWLSDAGKTIQDAGSLGVPEKENGNPDCTSKYMSIIQTGLVTGFSGIWGLRKHPIPVIKAGSCFVFELDREYKGDCELWIGERNMDGLGHVRIDRADDFQYANHPVFHDETKDDEIELELGETNISESNSDDKTQDCRKEQDGFKKLIAPIIIESIVEEKINQSLNKGTLNQITNSAAGRFKLMLMESVDKVKTNKSETDTDVEKLPKEIAWDQFNRRIESIKSDGARQSGEMLCRKIKEQFRTKENIKTDDLELLGYDKDESYKMVEKRWTDYAMAIIVDRKYNGKER